MGDKKRILVTGEASFLNTGYATIQHHLCERLHNLGYIVAEFANYGPDDFPDRNQIPWGYYGDVPSDNNPELKQHYNSEPLNQFGRLRFDDTVAHFKPDLVISYLDHWMSAHILESPLRKNFKFLWVPTVDASPQNEQWIADYAQVDYLGTYTDWALETLENQSGGKLPIIGTLTPGADYNTFFPFQNKIDHKKQAGLPDNAIIIGTVMRNQKRKLYPDLFKSFVELLKRSPNPENLYLYVHAAQPDLGFDLCKLITETNLSGKVYTTYVCRDCKSPFVSLFNDAIVNCKYCNRAASMASVANGVSREVLNSIYNLFDVYVQYANSEGLGVPVIEASSAGVHPFVVNYSGMADFAEKVFATPIEPISLTRESETHCYRAVPNNEEFIEKMLDFLSKGKKYWVQKGLEARKGVIKHYRWENTVGKIAQLADQSSWVEQPIRFCPMNKNILGDLSNSDFVNHAVMSILGPGIISDYFRIKLIRDLNTGYYTHYGESYITEDSILGNRQVMRGCSRETIIEELMKIGEKHNRWNRIRAGMVPYSTPEWILRSISK